ncbi:MAG: trigger factor [gamma proteobacterium symbiont of Phacoides pectinatus]
MQVSVESSEGLERRMKVELPVDQVNAAVENRLKEIARTIRLDGFRPGKVPMSVVRKRFAGQARHEVFGDLVQSTYYEALVQENLHPAGDPSIEPLDLPEERGMGYTAVFEVMPEVQVQSIEGKEIARSVAEVTDADVDAMIEKLRTQRTTWGEVEREAADGDQLTISFKGFVDGEAFDGGSADEVPLELGSGRMIEGFESGLVGAKAGESRTLELKFPDEYPAEKLAGKDATFEIEVNQVSEAVLPELDEEFAKVLGVAEGGVEALRKEIRSNMEHELEEKIQGQLKDQAMQILLEAHPIDIPKAMIEQDAKALQQQTRQNMVQSGYTTQADLPLHLFEGQAKNRITLGLVIGEVIKQNDLQLDEERVRAKVEQFAQSYEQPQEVIDYYYDDKNQQQLASVANVVMEDQVVDWIIGQVRVEEKQVSFAELMEPQQGAEAS